jgi:hypothetical protein
MFLWPAVAILLAAAALRLLWLHDVPPGLSQDEVLNADIVQLIRQGRHALFFREGFGHEPLYHYWSVPFQILLGDNVLSIRLPAVFLGLLLVAAAMRWARRDFGLAAALATGLGLAISWWPIVFSRIGIRPILEPLLLVAAFWLWPKRAGLAGLVLGLAVYTYTAARYVFLIPLGMAAYLFARRCHKSRASEAYGSLRQALIVFMVSLATFVPLALTLRADPNLQQRVGQLSEPLAALARGDFGPVARAALATLGVFTFTGDPRWTYSMPGRPLFDPLTGALFYLGLGLAFWRFRRPRYALILLWLAFGLGPSAISPDAPSTVRLVGAMPMVYLMPGLAVSFLWSNRHRLGIGMGRVGRPAAAAGVVLLAALLFLNLGRTVADGFRRWPAELQTRLRYQTVSLDMARHWREHPAEPLVLTDAYVEPIDLDSFARNLNSPVAGRWVQTGPVVAGALVLPAGAEALTLYVPEYAPVPLALLDAVDPGSEPVYRSPSEPSFAVYHLTPPAERDMGGPSVLFGGLATLLGYRQLDRQAGQPLELLTLWRVEASWPSDLAIFVHLVNPAGDIVAQHDGLDVYPEILWPGDEVVQLHILDLPQPAPPGPLSLQVGLYRRSTQSRLLHPGDPPDRVILDAGLNVD